MADVDVVCGDSVSLNNSFREKLRQRQMNINSLVCIGLNPLSEKMPIYLQNRTFFSISGAIVRWMIDHVDATAPYASMFKPQKAYYESFCGGLDVLQKIIHYIHTHYPNIPVLLDCKRGDIGRMQETYRIAHFDVDGADGMNFLPYMGKKCMESLFDSKHSGRAIVGLCYTSNPEAREVQDVIMHNGRPYWEFIAQCINKWSKEIGVNENAGLEMAAAYRLSKNSDEIFSRHLFRCRELVGSDLWFFISGIEIQSRIVEETVRAAYTGPGSIVIDLSSENFTDLGNNNNYMQAVGNKAKELCDMIRSVCSIKKEC